MLFNSLDFLIFLAAVLVLYFAVPYRFRWILLLIASYYFYACWKVEYVFLLAASTLVDYFVVRQMEKAQSSKHRKVLLWTSIVSNLGVLFAFKYWNFFNDTLRDIFNVFNVFYNVPAYHVLLPVGISFYTFQKLSYSIDVYRKIRPAERHLGIFALFVSFFPQLVAGPIERSTHLLPQFFEKHNFDFERFKSGLLLALWGFFKKLVIADRLAIYVDEIYSNPGAYEGFPVILATYFFAFQIYCDFSGYTDIAIGTGRMMGFRLSENFRRPFAARSVRDFWQRWHITLTKWVMDYVYFPLVKNIKHRWQGLAALVFVFVLIGLWHGAAWNFVLFGGFVGVMYVLGEVTRPIRQALADRILPEKGLIPRFHAALQCIIVFHVFVIAGIFFRIDSVADFPIIFASCFRGLEFSSSALTLPVFPMYELVIAIAAIAVMDFVEWLNQNHSIFITLPEKPIWLRWSFAYTIIFSILMLGEFRLQPFIYFEF